MGLGPAHLYNRSLEFLDGRGVVKDDARAFQLCEQAAAAGFRDAVLAMGWHYLNGVGVAADIEEAQRWYQRSARQGEPKAMFSLGQIADAAGNPESAMTWFERAAEHDHARSLYWMAKLYWRGDGVERNQPRAMTLLQQAAGRRDPEARRFLRYKSWCDGMARKRSRSAAEQGVAADGASRRR
jgi:TPR repeat protein